MNIRSVGEFNDFIRYIILKAPDHFPRDTTMDLEKAFAELFRGLDTLKSEIGAHADVIGQLMTKSLEAYRVGDMRAGIKNLQEVDQIVRSRLNE